MINTAYKSPPGAIVGPPQSDEVRQIDIGLGSPATQITSTYGEDRFTRTIHNNWLIGNTVERGGLVGSMHSQGMVSDGAGGWVKR